MTNSVTARFWLFVVILITFATPVCSGSEPREAAADLVRAEAWLQEVRTDGPDRLISKSPPPFPAKVLLDRQAVDWPTGQTQYILPTVGVSQDGSQKRERNLDYSVIECRKSLVLVVEVNANGQVVNRGIEVPPDNPLTQPDTTLSIEAHRQQHLTKMLAQRPCTLTAYYDNYFVEGIVRKMRGEQPVYDKDRLEDALRRIDHRIDCADFDLAFALRFYCLGAGSEQDRQRIRESALKFRYGDDDPGEDGMVFQTENHSILFYCDRLIAGSLWPDDVFANTGLKGREHALLGQQLCLDWLDKIEARGYEEFLSTTYAPITIGALMNLVDFSGDPGISRRAARQIDKIYRMMAEHCFDGVMIGVQGRTSRRMLYPQVLTTQALMSYATPQAVEAFDPWVIFAASSPNYRLSPDLDKLMASPICKQYSECGFLINLNKTSEYMLSSIEIPASAKNPSMTRGIVPGGRGHQHHIWHATLARDCHVFTTHPGSINDRRDGKPAYWTGNAIFPRQTQNGNTLMQIFSIPKDHPIQFTHSYWPSDKFDAVQIRSRWAFGRRNKSYIALWCSTKPALVSDVLTNRELRASGNKMAWVCICSDESESGDFNAFIRSCERLLPMFDPQTLTLRLQGQQPMKWDDVGKGTSK